MKGGLSLLLPAETEVLTEAEPRAAASSRSHFLLTSVDWTFPFCNFFRKLGNLVAGFLTIRRSFFGIACLPLDQDVALHPSLDL